uniref:Uncharacterized protein n=1 Tax=Mimivirus LCMiAC01 TaxID=2506608 RepID=A0A481Z1C8_9VIRU|nr:MAG: hypothetical protein LCMiAC01_01730 [Mimivirus LCMiAC01]
MSIFDPDDLYHLADDYFEEYTYACEEIDENKYVQVSYTVKISGSRKSNGKRAKQKNTKKEKTKKFGKYGGGQRKRQLLKLVEESDPIEKKEQKNTKK